MDIRKHLAFLTMLAILIFMLGVFSYVAYKSDPAQSDNAVGFIAMYFVQVAFLCSFAWFFIIRGKK